MKQKCGARAAYLVFEVQCNEQRVRSAVANARAAIADLRATLAYPDTFWTSAAARAEHAWHNAIMIHDWVFQNVPGALENLRSSRERLENDRRDAREDLERHRRYLLAGMPCPACGKTPRAREVRP